MTAMDGGNAKKLSGTIFATAMDGGNAKKLSGTIFAFPVGKASAPRQLLLHCPTTVHPWTYAHAPYLLPCRQKKPVKTPV
jgi:hypothetical protein